MEVLPYKLPNNPAKLKQMLLCQQFTFQQTTHNQQSIIARQEEKLSLTAKDTERLREQSVRQKTRIEILEDQLRLLRQHQFGKRSEKLFNPDQISLFNEAEIVADGSDSEVEEDEKITVPECTRIKRKSRQIPPELERVDVIHDLSDEEKQCACGKTLEPIGEEVFEQLCVIPQQHFALRHRKLKYACSCKECIRVASMPAQPIPASQASPRLLADVMVRKYLDGLPLYRQEKIAAREGFDLPRCKLARWMITGSEVFTPIINYLEECFFSYDIGQSDDTGIKVLKEDGRLASSQSALWIRRGGPPDKPVVLVDYETSKSGETAYQLLSGFHGFLVTDGASNFNASVRRNNLVPVLCNDHARRRFSQALNVIGKDKAKGTIAITGLTWYGKLYRIEAQSKHLSAQERLVVRQTQAVPLWEAFIEWVTKMATEGVAHGKTSEALSYLLKNKTGLQQYCTDGRLPISNIKSEHVAKTIALMRKNFLFSDTPSGATASARIFSLIETARANGHNPFRYLSVLLTELPQAQRVEDIEALLPWNLTPAGVTERFSQYPTP